MADTIRSEDAFLNSSTGLFKDNTAGDISAQDLRDFVKSSMVSQIGLFTGRLTLESGVYVSTTDQTGKTSLFLCGPQNGNIQTWLYDGTSWKYYTFSQLTLASPSLTAGTPYDVWLYDNAGSPTLEVLAWTNATTRATALATQDGVIVKSGAATRRYVGTVYPSATNTMEDSLARRLVWNLYNQIARPMYVHDGTNSWTYTSATWRQKNASTVNQVDFVCGIAGESLLNLFNSGYATHSAGSACRVGIGIDSTTAFTDAAVGSMAVAAGEAAPLVAVLASYPAPLGYHYAAAIENTGASTATFYGDAGASTLLKTALEGTITC